MAGFLGWIRWDGAEASVAAALACLRHHPSFRGEMLAGDGRCGVAVSYRPGDPPEVHRIPERGLLVAVLGAVLEHRDGRWHRFTAAELADAYLERGLPAVSGLDGSYQLLIWDEPAGRLHFLNDRIGSRYMQHARCDAGVAFAPEAKALFRLLPLRPRMDFTGMVSFLNLGYPVGTHTLFEGVRLLAPAHRWTLDLRTGQVEEVRTWVQRFEPDRKLSLWRAAELLYEAVLVSHQAPLEPQGAKPWIALTGGYDSRVMMAALERLGRLPQAAFTWGARDDLPGSDPAIARELAQRVGVPHTFLPYHAEDFLDRCDRWLEVGEGTTDNLGYYAAGPEFLEALPGRTPAAVYVGDVVIASGSVPRSVHEAVATVTRVPPDRFAEPLHGLLRPSVREGLLAAMVKAREEVVACSPSSRPEDVQDFLWGQFYNFRWLFGPSFYREPMVTALRPMLLGPMYDCLAVLPAPLRAYRRVWVEMLTRHLSRYAREPRAFADSLIHWNREAHAGGSLNSWLAANAAWEALANTPLASWLNEEQYRKFFARFRQPAGAPPRGRRLRAVWAGFRRRFSTTACVGLAIRGVECLTRAGDRLNVRIDATRLSFRFALLARLASAPMANNTSLAGEGQDLAHQANEAMKKSENEP